MPIRQQCPACQAQLRIPDSISAPSVTCPRCLAEVPNPGARSEPGFPLAAETPAHTVATRPCPECRKPVLPHYYFCPHCDAPLRVGNTRVEGEVRRDTQGTGIGLIVLALLGAVSLFIPFLTGLGMAARGRPQGVATAGIIMIFVLLVGTGIMWWQTIGNPQARGLARAFLTGLAFAGFAVAATAALAFAAVIVLFAVCLAGARGFR